MAKKSRLQEHMEQRIANLRETAKRCEDIVTEHQLRAEEAANEADMLQGLIDTSANQGDDSGSDPEPPEA